MKFSHLRGYAFFLSLHTQYSLSKYIERDRAIQILMSLFSFKMSTFVCVFISSISSCSPSPSPLVNTSSIPMIPLKSLWLIHVCTQNLYILSLVSTSWGVDEVLITENTTPQHCGFNNFSTHLTIPAPIKSIFSMDFISLFCTTTERSLCNNNHKSVYWKKIECSLYFLETVHQIHLNVNLTVRELWGGLYEG